MPVIGRFEGGIHDGYEFDHSLPAITNWEFYDHGDPERKVHYVLSEMWEMDGFVKLIYRPCRGFQYPGQIPYLKQEKDIREYLEPKKENNGSTRQRIDTGEADDRLW